MYERVGTYAGPVPLEALAARRTDFEVAWAPDGHGTTTDHLIAVRDVYQQDVAQIPGVWAYSMLVLLQPFGFIPLHQDLPQRAGLERYHLVLTTNGRCWNYHDGGWQQLEAGGIYKMDAMAEHGSVNWGETERVHLVVDVEA